MKKKTSIKNKRHLHVLIDEKLYNELIKIAPLIYGEGKYRGAINYVVEEALCLYPSRASRPRRQRSTESRL